MNEQKKITFQSRLPRLELQNKPVLIITEKLKRQIDYLHNKVGSREWSGELITREEGQITDLDNWTVIAEDIFIADIGSGTFTGYEVDKAGFKAVDIIQMYDAFPGMLAGTHKNQHCHSHHCMQSFFSSTDWEQLEDRGVTHNYFIMLIVNFAGQYVAKCAFKGKRKVTTSPTLEFSNNADNYTPFTLNPREQDEEVLVVMDMEVRIPEVSHAIPLSEEVRTVMQNLSRVEEAQEGHLSILLEHLNDCVKHKTYLVDEPFRLRYEAVAKAVEEEKTKKTLYTPYKQGSFGWEDNYGWGNESFGNKKSYGEKKISEMTDKEFHDFDQSQNEWGFSDVKALLNATIAGNYAEDRITDPVEQFKRLDKKLKSKNNREEWVQEFQMGLSSMVYEFWKEEPTANEAHNLLKMCLEYLIQYKQVKLIEDVCEAIETEMDYMTQEIMYYSNYEKRGGCI